MATFIVGFDGKWQERFDDEEEAVDWAREVAATGRTVEVVRRRFGFCKFITGFPETNQAELRARWRRPVGLFIGAGASGVYGGGDSGGDGGDGGGGC
ncbi:MAG TPA: hypothetical protein VN752_05915 [Solirubrobacterales bacterium]|nr:hypothetical protein [Solirubrobacterales bacterium]